MNVEEKLHAQLEHTRQLIERTSESFHRLLEEHQKLTVCIPDMKMFFLVCIALNLVVD